jgi:hypothetical protein
MSSYLDVNGDPNEVTGIGARLKGQAESFAAQAQAILGDIQSIEGRAPWGNDEIGQTFLARYNGVPEGGDTPFSQSLQDELSHAGENLGNAGDAIMLAMSSYQSTDSINEGGIKGVKKV